MDAGRASRFTSAATKAALNVGLKEAAGVDAPIRRRVHQLNAPARAVHLRLKDAIGGTGRQTEATMDTLVEQ